MNPAADASGDEGFELELERRLADKADWNYAGQLADRVAELERWRAGLDAVTAWRRWAAPSAISVTGLILTIINIAAMLAHHK